MVQTGRCILPLLLIALVTPVAAQSISVDTSLSNHVFSSGENRTYSIIVRSSTGAAPNATVTLDDRIRQVITVTDGAGEETQLFQAHINAPDVEQETTFSGNLIVRSQEDREEIPVFLQVLPQQQEALDWNVGFVSATTTADKPPRIHVRFGKLAETEAQTVDVMYNLHRSSSGKRIGRVERTYVLNTSVSKIVEFTVSRQNLTEGEYYVQAAAIHDEKVYTALDTIQVNKPLWTGPRIRAAGFIILAIILSVVAWKGHLWYVRRREEQARYVYPVDYDKLPSEEDSYWVGKVAETHKEAHVDPTDLTTHAIVAGSTGAGKSVTASVVVEEALENDVPVVVFDPTAQWTGFVKKCMDNNLLDHYQRFDMDPQDDPHPYPGLIKKMEPEQDINFEQLMNPGEITVFTLDHLTTEEFDTTVRTIIDSIFDIEWEESSNLELVIVFDEVHRLLEKYGGKGGYEALERGAREFRKWGIGLIMSSQVTADFKQAVSGNIMTEIQMQTKSMEDINRIKQKYGEKFAKRVTSEEVGTGMIQNPQYNDGDPWFVDFRPTYHNPHKIPDEELDQYHEYTDLADTIQARINQLEKQDKDMYDEQLELDLATKKLKQGRFQMAEMYLKTLADKLGLENDT
jgi:hypothetical protein